MTRKRLVVLAVLVALVAGGWKAYGYMKLHGLGLISSIMDPIGPPRDVTWEAGPSVAGKAADARPNVIVIVADDLGYNDLSWNGGGVAGGTVATPRIDSIARDGVQLAAGYAGNATCAPSRAAILTGRYPTRFGFEFTPAPKVFMRLVSSMGHEQPNALRAPIYHSDREAEVPPFDQEGVPAEEVTLAELLRAQGYHTVGLGKWHLGEAEAQQPLAQGFDEYLGFYAGGSMYLDADDPRTVNAVQDFDPIDTFLWANLPFAVRSNGSKRFRPREYMTDYLGEEAVKAIDANRNRPFFLYFAPNAPHTPLQALRSDYDALPEIKDHRLRVYAAMIRALDRNVGRILDAVKANGLENNTLVIFTSDNGGANYVGLPDLNRPYRGWKMTFFEGGVHSPFFVKWPAQLPSGATFTQPVGHIDIFATAAGAAGAQLPADRKIDGVNLIPFLRGDTTGAPHEALYWRSGHYKMVLADGWKLQVSERPKKDWLFNLTNDPTEGVDLAAQRPEKLQEMKALLARYDSEMVKPAWPSLIEGPINVDKPLDVPDTANDEYVYWEKLTDSRFEGADMEVVNKVYPTPEQFIPLATDPRPGPVAMVNLIKFRDRAEYADGRAAEMSGREAYMLYVAEMKPIVEKAGGRILVSGDVQALVLGEVETLWDVVGVVEYPSRAEFQRIATSPEVQAIGVHREAGLAGQLLIMIVEDGLATMLTTPR